MEQAIDHAAAMDAQYRWQRHIYDFTRKYYLLGRDSLIHALAPRAGDAVLEIGCGTGRNLALATRLYPGARLYGIDISKAMLDNARGAVPTARLAQGDATGFDAMVLFRRPNFDRIFMSYTLSMIPDWQAALDQAARLLGRGGRLHIVDFGQQEGLPRWFGRLLAGWLHAFHVTPREGLFNECKAVAERESLSCTTRARFRGYAWEIVLTRVD